MRHTILKNEFNHLISGLGHALLFMVFALGLPVLTLASIQGICRLFEH